jgi:hypothetical protein
MVTRYSEIQAGVMQNIAQAYGGTLSRNEYEVIDRTIDRYHSSGEKIAKAFATIPDVSVARSRFGGFVTVMHEEYISREIENDALDMAFQLVGTVAVSAFRFAQSIEASTQV